MRLNPKAFGLALGILKGLALVVITFWVMACDGGNTVALLEQFYIGYSISLLGALIGFIYSFIVGFISGYLIAWLYNRFSGAGK